MTQADPRIEARERLEAWLPRAEIHINGKGDYAVPMSREDAADLRTILTALSEAEGELDRVREKLAFYANPEIYKPHPHGPAFDDRDLSFIARAALSPTRRTGDA